MSGWYAQLRQAKDPARLAWACRRLAATVRFLRRAQILDFAEAAIERYEELKRLRVKVRKVDLQIAATAGATIVDPQHSGFQARSRTDRRRLVEIGDSDMTGQRRGRWGGLYKYRAGVKTLKAADFQQTQKVAKW